MAAELRTSGIETSEGKALNEAGVMTADDLLGVLPRVPGLVESDAVLARAGAQALLRLRVVTQPSLSYPRRGLSLVRAWGEDQTGRCALQWFNQPYVRRAIRRGEEYLFLRARRRVADLSRQPPAGRRRRLPGSCRVPPFAAFRPGCWATSCDGCSGLRNRETLPPGWPGASGSWGLPGQSKTSIFRGRTP